MQRFLMPARAFLRHRDLVALLGCCLILGLGIAFVSPFLSIFGTQEVGMSRSGFGVFMTITSLSGIGLSTLLARVSDTRTTRRSMLLLGSVSGVLGYIGFAFVRNPVGLTVIGSLLLGLASITFSQLFAHARETLMGSGIPARNAPLYMNVFRLFMALAWTVGPAVAALVMVRFSFTGTFLGAAICYAVFAGAVLVFIPATPVPGAAAVGRTSLLATLARRDILAHFAGFALVFMATTMCMISVPLLVLESLGGTVAQVGIIYCIAPVFELPFMLWLGLLATRTDQSRLIRIAVALAAVYNAALCVVRAPWHIYPLQALSAAVTAVVQGVAITFFQNFLPEQPGTATNLFASAQRTGSTAGYLAFGTIAAFGGYRAVFASGTALCGLALVLLWAHRPRVAGPQL